MSSLQNNTGEADGTTNIGSYRIRLFNAYQKINFESLLKDITKEYLYGDKTRLLLTDFSNWLSTTAIPKFLMKYLE